MPVEIRSCLSLSMDLPMSDYNEPICVELGVDVGEPVSECGPLSNQKGTTTTSRVLELSSS